jgi:nucleoside-diphosphate-sugar epimerase
MTGATGFLGRAVARVLADRGAQLRCLVRPGSERAVLSGVSCEFVEGDLARPETLGPAVAGCSTVVHLAAETGPAPVARLHAVNVLGSGELARQAREAGAERFVYASTLLRAGHGTELPRPWATVARSKLAGEAAVLRHIPAAIRRCAPCFGPNDHLACPIMARLRRPGLAVCFPGQGTFHTQPIWVEDLAECLALAALEGKEGDGPRDLAGPDDMIVLEFWDALAAAVGAFRVRFHLPETCLRLGGFALARTLGRKEFLRLAEFTIGHSATENNFAPVLLGRPLVSVAEGLSRMLGTAAKGAGRTAPA